MKTKKVHFQLDLTADITLDVPIKLQRGKLKKLLKSMQFQLSNYQTVGDDINISNIKLSIATWVNTLDDQIGFFEDDQCAHMTDTHIYFK